MGGFLTLLNIMLIVQLQAEHHHNCSLNRVFQNPSASSASEKSNSENTMRQKRGLIRDALKPLENLFKPPNYDTNVHIYPYPSSLNKKKSAFAIPEVSPSPKIKVLYRDPQVQSPLKGTDIYGYPRFLQPRKQNDPYKYPELPSPTEGKVKDVYPLHSVYGAKHLLPQFPPELREKFLSKFRVQQSPPEKNFGSFEAIERVDVDKKEKIDNNAKNSKSRRCHGKAKYKKRGKSCKRGGKSTNNKRRKNLKGGQKKKTGKSYISSTTDSSLKNERNGMDRKGENREILKNDDNGKDNSAKEKDLLDRFLIY